MSAKHAPAKADNSRQFIGLLIFMEVHRRALGGQFGRLPTALKDWAFAEGGYCLDAPETLPAGGCYFAEVEPPDGEEGPYGISAQITVTRTGGSS